MGIHRYQHAHNRLIVVRRNNKEKPYALAALIPSRNGVMVSVLNDLRFAEDRLDIVLKELGNNALVDPREGLRQDLFVNLEHPGKYQIWRYETFGYNCEGTAPIWTCTGFEVGTDNPALGRRIVEKLNKTTPKYVKFHMERSDKRRQY